MTLRYAILQHTAIAKPHYDLLFETTPGSGLATWRSAAWPIGAAVEVERLTEHRPVYLDFEGPLSGDRGRVARVAGGTFVWVERTDAHWRLRLDTGRPFSLTPRLPPWWLMSPEI